MSRTETALKPLVENNSSAAARIASRKFGLRAAASFLVGRRTILFVHMYKRSGPGNKEVPSRGGNQPRDAVPCLVDFRFTPRVLRHCEERQRRSNPFCP